MKNPHPHLRLRFAAAFLAPLGLAAQSAPASKPATDDMLFAPLATLAREDTVALESSQLRLVWRRGAVGWQLATAEAKTPKGPLPLGAPSGAYTLLHSPSAPATTPSPLDTPQHPKGFPEASFRFVKKYWDQAIIPAALNTAGSAHEFFPDQVEQTPTGRLKFRRETEFGRVTAEWWLDADHPGDVRVILSFEAKTAGFYSLATPTLAVLDKGDLAWGMVPGCWAGSSIEPDLIRSYGYGHGLPARPVLARERVATTLASLVEHRNGATLAAIAEPGQAEDPWRSDKDTRQVWRLGLSHMNRRAELAPTLYHPVLGQAGSELKAGSTVRFDFRYSIRTDGWLGVLRHAAYDIYGLKDFLTLKQPREALSRRLLRLGAYVRDDATSGWHTYEYRGQRIGAQAYGSATFIKNADYGTMWMLARLTSDPKLLQERLPQARAFKLAQQETAPGFFQGSTVPYYSATSGRFTEEHGNRSEPIGLTYYTLCDVGNMLLYAPDDQELKERLRLGAERLLAWQQADGRWDLCYDRKTQQPMYPDLTDLRPTFYGLLVAYRALGDAKYLAAARRGADWLLANALPEFRFLGACSDGRFAQDFATSQVVQSFLEMHETTRDSRYLDAAISTAKFYFTSIYTHPRPSRQEKSILSFEPVWYRSNLAKAGKELGPAPMAMQREDWEISQMGLPYEQGGVFSSADESGPILLVCHAGMFIRLYQLTGEPMFRDLARAGALARDAFVNPGTGMASYYWSWMDYGAGPWPHHAWWQIGWIVDYLIAEANLRSEGAIKFPMGFFTPKVGPHGVYGHAPGRIFGEAAELSWGDLSIDRPEVDWILAKSPDGRRRFAVLLNNSSRQVTATVSGFSMAKETVPAPTGAPVVLLDAAGNRKPLSAEGPWTVELPPYGLAVLVAGDGGAPGP